ncbi:MAG: lysophospholipid acyltransferase family protein [Candidatus Omnitrophica bacterium]|nr:lysophospholipid acyltransferase family protein [Candidatus Omnitrophota bacterium]MDD5351767.1 lysophospholipid acyltransferase family protein [Candidatus Omnitrophota bacterium]MDD5550978.1 lysophospholipid acyltransferase family protein [Candidatus Omnitrophota bacterium]
MQIKELSRRIQRFFARIMLQFCVLIIKLIPEKYVYGFAHILAKLGFAVAAKHRRVAFESLNIAFGKEKKEEEIKQIAVDCFENIAKMVVEFMVFLDKPDFINRYVTVRGIENLDKALAKKKGVVALSAHFGNFPLMLAKLAAQGYEIATMLRYMRDPWVSQYFHVKRENLGISSIYTQPRKQCVEKSLETLRQNKILFIQLDQNFGTGGVFVDFFGKKAATAKGPIVFALRTKSPIVPMFIYREKNNMQRVVIEPEAEIAEGKDFEETIYLTAQKLTGIIESYARRYPSDWGWIHKRWKARPKEEIVPMAEELSL